MNRLQPTFRLLIAAVLSLILAGGSLGQEFRVETDVFLDDAKEPFSQHITVFSGSVVYDFTLPGPEETTIVGPKEVTILDTVRGKVVLLNVLKQEKAELTTADLLEFTAQIKQVAQRDQANELLLPQFEKAFDKQQQILELRSKHLTYRVTGISPRQSPAVDRYREFADWYCRLNAMRPGNLPPFGRLELNRNLAEHGLLPQEIERNLRLGKVLPTTHTARSKHLIQWQLSNTDRRRIRDAGGQRVSFPTVSLQKYMQLEKVAER